MKKLFSVAALAIGLGVTPAEAMVVRFGPPPPVREVVVACPSPRHVWVPGYYRWHGGRYAWVGGRWAVPPRHHAAWVPGHWASRRGGFVWVGGFWR
jgi:hypothetical protein